MLLTRHIDPQTGRAYLYDAARGTSRWEDTPKVVTKVARTTYDPRPPTASQSVSTARDGTSTSSFNPPASSYNVPTTYLYNGVSSFDPSVSSSSFNPPASSYNIPAKYPYNGVSSFDPSASSSSFNPPASSYNVPATYSYNGVSSFDPSVSRSSFNPQPSSSNVPATSLSNQATSSYTPSASSSYTPSASSLYTPSALMSSYNVPVKSSFNSAASSYKEPATSSSNVSKSSYNVPTSYNPLASASSFVVPTTSAYNPPTVSDPLALSDRPDWMQLVDQATRRTFWYNKTLKKSQWENPLDSVKQIKNKPTPAVASVSLGVHQASQWEKFFDPNTDRVFFFHRRLGVSQWERPEELGAWSPIRKPPPTLKAAPIIEGFKNEARDFEEFAASAVPTNSSASATKMPYTTQNTTTEASDDVVSGELSELMTSIKNPSKLVWRRRTFRLTKAGLLMCGAAKVDVPEDVVKIQEFGDSSFSLIGSLKTTLARLRANSPDDYANWLGALNRFVLCSDEGNEPSTTKPKRKHLSRKKSSDSSAAPSPSSSPLPSPPPIHVVATKPIVAKTNEFLERLRRTFGQNEALLIKVNKLRKDFHSENRQVHEAKVSALLSLDDFDGNHHTQSQYGAPTSRHQVQELLAAYGRFWGALRSHPSALARICSWQKTNEARIILVGALAGSFLDECSLPFPYLLKPLAGIVTGTAFERPLFDAFASFRSYRAYGNSICGAVLDRLSRSKALMRQSDEVHAVDMTLRDLADAIQKRPRVPHLVKELGRFFLTSVLLMALNPRAQESELGRLVMDAIENQTFPKFESRMRSFLAQAKDCDPLHEEDAVLGSQLKHGDDEKNMLPLNAWEFVVCSRADLYALHMAASRFNGPLPDDVMQCLVELGEPKPLTDRDVSNYFVLQCSQRDSAAGEEDATELDEFIVRVRGVLQSSDLKPRKSELAELEKQLELTVKIAKTELPLLLSALERLARFRKEFYEETTAGVRTIATPRFNYANSASKSTSRKSAQTPNATSRVSSFAGKRSSTAQVTMRSPSYASPMRGGAAERAVSPSSTPSRASSSWRSSGATRPWIPAMVKR